MHAPAQGAASVVRTERHKILVVEDEQDFRETLAALLETHGFDALQAANGAEGIELARQNRPDLIICDIHMSGVNGYGALEALRSRTDTATIPFIFLTGDRDPSGLRRGMESGADDYLLKPVAPETLLATIRARLTKLDAQRRQEHETHARLLAVFEATPDLIAVAELEDRHITYINRAGLRILGVPRADDIASLHLQNLFTPAAWTHLRDAALPATQRDGNWLGESALLALDGHEVPVSLVLLRHPAAAGQGGYFSLIARDISEGKRLQSELSHERDLLSALMDIVREQIVFKDREGRFMRANKAAAERLGLDEPAQV
ncbi:MAG: response regulator, partial [Verrucomicrobia bacterium]|nr:response regulator [Verrucomicrobiota bacterium]